MDSTITYIKVDKEYFENLRDERNDLKRQREALAKVIQKVEWVEWHNWTDPSNPKVECPWCGNLEWKGHAKDCPRQAALAMNKE